MALLRRPCATGRSLLLAGLLAPFPWTTSAGAAAGTAEVKAAFVLNFVKFTRWPVVPPPPFRLCFLTAGDPVGSVAAQSYAQSSEELRMEIYRGLELKELSRCDLVFLGEQDGYRITEVLSALGKAPTLTVSDLPHFLEAGGMIQLLPEGRKFRFAVNLEVVRESRLELDGRLLSLARNLEGFPDDTLRSEQ